MYPANDDVKHTHYLPNSDYTGSRFPVPLDHRAENHNHIYRGLNGDYTVLHPPTINHQVPNGDYTVSHHAHSTHQLPNSDYIVSNHVNTHQLPNGDYTVSYPNPAYADESCSSSNCHDDNPGIIPNDVDIQPQDVTQGPAPQHQIQIQPNMNFLKNCNPVRVDNSVLADIKRMVSTTWPVITPEARRAVPHFAQIYDAVKRYDLPNFAGAQIPVPSGIKVENWVNLLHHYHDNEICHFLQFGWPLGFYSEMIPESVNKNHPSALAHSTHIDEFIRTELNFQALAGPIDATPFTPWFRISPLMTRPKKGSSQRRVIVDLSYPDGSAVNSGINIQEYLGRDISYSLPTVTDLISKLQVDGKGALVWKADLARAYHQLRADPLDAPLLGIKHNDKIYLDRCPPFGCRSSSAACQRMANALVYILASNSHHCLAYLDDFAGCNSDISRATAGFNAFITLADHLGLQLSNKKCMPPSTSVEWLGYKIDTLQMTVSIPEAKLTEVLEECQAWFHRKRVTRTMVQSLAGKLSHVAGCVQHGRKFLARILGALRADSNRKWLTIDEDFLKDVRWFYLYARTANGISLYSQEIPHLVIECDSSLQGAGGNTDKYCYTWQYDKHHIDRFPAIHQMEAVNILVAYRTLTHQDTNDPTRVLILTDNIASSTALMTGRTKDPVLGACARELWLEAAKRDDSISIEHRPGTSIPLADGLSRMSTDEAKAAYVRDTVKNKGLTFVPPALKNYEFFDSDL